MLCHYGRKIRLDLRSSGGEAIVLANDFTVGGRSSVTGGVGVPVIQAVCSCGSPQKIRAMTCGNSAWEINLLMPAGIDPKDA